MNPEDASALYEEGNARFAEVYAGDLPQLPEGMLAFNDVMIRTLFAQVWSHGSLSMRDRRLLVMGVIAARGTADAWRVQARAALRNEEMTADELRETLIMLAPYAGYPSVSSLVTAAEEVIAGAVR